MLYSENLTQTYIDSDEPETIGICAGCGEDIYKYEDYCEIDSAKLHDEDDCIVKYVKASNCYIPSCALLSERGFINVLGLQRNNRHGCTT